MKGCNLKFFLIYYNRISLIEEEAKACIAKIAAQIFPKGRLFAEIAE